MYAIQLNQIPNDGATTFICRASSQQKSLSEASFITGDVPHSHLFVTVDHHDQPSPSRIQPQPA